ncbi:hypothetical protein L7F22_018492 [Adiantum nelumboides]|nr:hypothetical protein [Adiantum nelumboides]MCO5564824.1 hypothetical protein [Adiantum nelumboides]
MEEQKHLLLFTHNEQSHITPMFALARALAGRGMQVTCALPATAYASYISNNTKLPSTQEQAFRVEPVEQSPQHSSNDLLLLQKKLEEGLAQLFCRLHPPPSSLIADIIYFSWSQEFADRFGLPFFLFSPFIATTLLAACYLPQFLQKGLLPFQPGMEDEVIDFIPGLMKGFRLGDVPLEFLGRTSEELEAFRFLEHSKTSAGLVMCNTSYSLKTLLYCEDDRCLSWLDRQPQGSVVYASFGSINPLTKEEVQELALGLEACGQPFLWVIRCIDGAFDVVSMLPPGYLERIKDKGLIVSWAPQMAVFSHASVGCFLFDCGASSLLEAIWTGVPMIGGFYKISDQNTMFCMMVEGWRVALPLRQSQTHSPLRSSIEAAIKEVLYGERVCGEGMRQRIAQLRDALKEAAGPSGISQRYLDQLVNVLLSPAKETAF